MESAIKKWGGSKAVIVPETIDEQLGLEVGDHVEIEIVKKAKISGFGKFPRAKPFVREEGALERKI